MTTSTSTHPQPRKQTVRPSVWRLLASKYVDLLICGFIAWVVCFTFGWQAYWPTLTLLLWVGETFWCRDRLNPTAGEFCLGIRYLTSSSSQVVADIQVVHNKLKLNGFLLTAGVVELTLAIFFFCGWTFFGKAAMGGHFFGPPLSLVFWILGGSAFFLCSGYLLSGSRKSFWAVPLVHGWFTLDFFLSYPAWKGLLQSDLISPPWMAGMVAQAAKSQSFLFLELFVLWSLFVATTLLFSRKQLVN